MLSLSLIAIYFLAFPLLVRNHYFAIITFAVGSAIDSGYMRQSQRRILFNRASVATRSSDNVKTLSPPTTLHTGCVALVSIILNRTNIECHSHAMLCTACH